MSRASIVSSILVSAAGICALFQIASRNSSTGAGAVSNGCPGLCTSPLWSTRYVLASDSPMRPPPNLRTLAATFLASASSAPGAVAFRMADSVALAARSCVQSPYWCSFCSNGLLSMSLTVESRCCIAFLAFAQLPLATSSLRPRSAFRIAGRAFRWVCASSAANTFFAFASAAASSGFTGIFVFLRMPGLAAP